MKWVIFTGTWKLKANKQVESDVIAYTRRVIAEGNGIVTGGATGVDLFCMREYLKLDPTCKRIRIFIPAKLNHYIEDYRKNWTWDPLTTEDIDELERILITIKTANPAALFEVRKESSDITQDEYDLRHNEEVTFSDALYAFHVNGSSGTQDTIDKAQASGLPIEVHLKYNI